MKAAKFLKVTFPNSIRVELQDHEVHMAFTDDEDAHLFREWWSVRGAELFGSWHAEQANEVLE